MKPRWAALGLVLALGAFMPDRLDAQSAPPTTPEQQGQVEASIADIEGKLSRAQIIDPATLQIRGLTTRDRQGGESAITFLKLKENQGISDKEFVFRIPRGVDVVRTDDASN